MHASEQDRPDVARRRSRWHRYQGRIDPTCLVFIDETWTKTNMAPLRGWSRRGVRLIDKVPHGHWQTLTFLAALRHDGITAPCVLDGPINGRSFRAYVEQILAPTLWPGDIVVMDNLGSHKSQEVRRLIRSAGARLFFLPPYSPDLNPIEQCSPSSRRCCAGCVLEASSRTGAASEPCSRASRRASAQTISGTPDTLLPKLNVL